MEGNGQLHAPADSLRGKNPQYPLDRRLGGPQSRSGRGGEEKNSLPRSLGLISLYFKEITISDNRNAASRRQDVAYLRALRGEL
jgi:hypothetical protein